METDGQDHPGMVKDGHGWSDWLTAKEAEVYSLQVHQFKIKEKTWRRLANRQPPPVQVEDENIPSGTRYIFLRSDMDTWIADRKKEAKNSIARSGMDMGGQDHPGVDEDTPDHTNDEEHKQLEEDNERLQFKLEVQEALVEEGRKAVKRERKTSDRLQQEVGIYKFTLVQNGIALPDLTNMPRLQEGEGQGGSPEKNPDV